MTGAQNRSRRGLAAIASAALALGLTACGGGGGGTAGSQEQNGVTTLTWQMWSGSKIETDALNQLSAMVTKAHPDIKMQLQTSTFPDYWTKLTAQASGGNVGCILGVQAQRVPLVSQLLTPLDATKLTSAGIDMTQYNGQIAKALQSDGQQVAVPYDFGPLVVFYNADAFSKAGVKAPAPGWTVDDFLAAAKKLQASGIDGYGFFPTPDQFAAWSLALAGKQPITTDGKLQADSPEMVKTFQWLQDLHRQNLSPQLPATTDTSTALNAFMAGQSAMVVDGPWQYGNIVQNAKFTPGLAPMPGAAQGPTSIIAGSGYGISKSCASPDKALQALATITGPDALKYLGEVGRAYPARTAVSDSWYQGKLAKAKPSLDYAIEHAEFQHTNAQMNQVSQLFTQYGIPAFNGQQSAKDFLGLVQQQAGSAS